MMSRLAAAADMCRLGCLTLEEQSSARANVPTERATTRNWSICRSDSPCAGVHTSVSSSELLRVSSSPADGNTHVINITTATLGFTD